MSGIKFSSVYQMTRWTEELLGALLSPQLIQSSEVGSYSHNSESRYPMLTLTEPLDPGPSRGDAFKTFPTRSSACFASDPTRQSQRPNTNQEQQDRLWLGDGLGIAQVISSRSNGHLTCLTSVPGYCESPRDIGIAIAAVSQLDGIETSSSATVGYIAGETFDVRPLILAIHGDVLDGEIGRSCAERSSRDESSSTGGNAVSGDRNTQASRRESSRRGLGKAESARGTCQRRAILLEHNVVSICGRIGADRAQHSDKH